ncbi:MAG TPA: hypothetical protein VKV74_13785 [Bryobacteraceae bacterium]|nr:hypothetical protein [Bryobacteraceae bacterium]
MALFVICSALLGAVLVWYSQTYAFTWDEGFHLLAAQLIEHGKKPYLDFAFAQTPLNAYWNAFLMRIFGENWRVIQAADALTTTAAVVLAADFLRTRFKPWGAASLAAVVVLAGANNKTIIFGTIGQAYAVGLLLTVAAFRLTVAAVDRDRKTLAGLAGLCAGGAAGSTLLTGPAAPVLLAWTIYCSPPGKRLFRGAAFVAGAGIALAPLFVLLAQSPTRVIFDVFRYHMFYRRSDWPGATRHDLEMFAAWIDSPQALTLGILAAAGLWFIARRSGWEPGRRRELYLCGWLSLALALYVSTAHPTFTQYYLFTTPFLSILSAVGLFAASAQLGIKRPLWPTLSVCLLVSLGLVKELYDRRDDRSWQDMEAIARKVSEVTPPGAPLSADEHIYFLTRRTPPSGNEYISSHKVRLPAAFSEFVHIVPQPEIDRRIAEGDYATLQTCEDDDWIQDRKLAQLYRQRAHIAECDVFWDWAGGKP